MESNKLDTVDASKPDAAKSPATTVDASEEEGVPLESTLDASDAPSLPEEQPPPLPAEPPPGQVEDDGWAPVWDDRAQAFYFFNRFTNVSQWENPRISEALQPPPPGVDNYNGPAPADNSKHAAPVVGGYNPAIHGDFDPNADYAKVYEPTNNDPSTNNPATADPSSAYAATGTFNRFTGKWQAAELNPEKFNDENKSRRQMNAFFDVDAAANSHDGRSLKAERSGKKLSKKEVKAFKDKRREKKEEKRRAWLKD